MPEVKVRGIPEHIRVFVSGCVERGDGSSFRKQGHAHNYKTDPYFGWICIRSPKRLYTSSGSPSRLMMEEVAHILTPNHKHDATWLLQMKALCQPVGRLTQRRIKKTKAWKREKGEGDG